VQRGLSTPVLILAPRRQSAGAFQTIVKEFERRIPIAGAEKVAKNWAKVVRGIEIASASPRGV